jgi:hypothetical protein
MNMLGTPPWLAAILLIGTAIAAGLIFGSEAVKRKKSTRDHQLLMMGYQLGIADAGYAYTQNCTIDCNEIALEQNMTAFFKHAEEQFEIMEPKLDKILP